MKAGNILCAWVFNKIVDVCFANFIIYFSFAQLSAAVYYTFGSSNIVHWASNNAGGRQSANQKFIIVILSYIVYCAACIIPKKKKKNIKNYHSSQTDSQKRMRGKERKREHL